MEDINLDIEFKMLKEYMDIYIQLLPFCDACGGKVMLKSDLPTFEYFKETYGSIAYSMAKPMFKESFLVYGNVIAKNGTQGLGSISGIGYRYVRSWHGARYFTGGNIFGDYFIQTESLNKILKTIQ